MSFAYMPFYTGDYYRDTRHLSMLQHGAYRQLLDHCWDQKGPLPLDMARCFRICGAVSKEEQDAVTSIISEFFVRMDDGHYNKRMQQEIERSASISSTRADAAHTRWKAREALQRMNAASHDANALQMQSTSNANGPSPSPSPSLTSTPKDTESGAARSATPPPAYRGDENEGAIHVRAIVMLSAEWELPESWGKDAEALGWKPSAIVKEAERFRQYWVSGKGSGKRRSVKGWRQSWSNWINKAAARR